VVTSRVTRKRLSTRTHAMRVTTRHVCLEHSTMRMKLAPSRQVGISNRPKATVQVNVCLPPSCSRRVQVQRPLVLLTVPGCPAHLWAGMEPVRSVNLLPLRLLVGRPPRLPSLLDVPAPDQALPQVRRHFPGPLRPCFSPSRSSALNPTVTSRTSRPTV
jgi:hypothetical protein